MAAAVVEALEWSQGERLAKARKHAGLTQPEMAKRLGVSASAVAKWEADRGQPRHFMAVIEQWSTVTGVSQEWLLGLRTGSFATLEAVAYEGQMELPFDAESPTLAVLAGGGGHTPRGTTSCHHHGGGSS